MSLPTPSQSVSHKWFHQCVNLKKKQSLRHPLSMFGSFSFFQESIWLRVDKVLRKLTKLYENELRHLFQCCILIPRKCPRKTPFQYTVPPSPSLDFWSSYGPAQDHHDDSGNVQKLLYIYNDLCVCCKYILKALAGLLASCTICF